VTQIVNLSESAALVAATIAMGLASGLFYTFACSVMIGLGQADDRTFVEAMQRINVAILNLWFAAGFGGAFVLTVIAAALSLRADGRPTLPWIVAALILYVGTLAITFFINVPLNDQLAAAGEPDHIADLGAVRQRFEGRWVRWNIVRALTATAAFGCLTWALVLHGRGTTGGS
jgi:uncharacterized membrane protein